VGTIHFKRQLAALSIMGAAVLPLQASIFFVGSGPGCQFGGIQDAVNAAAGNPGADTVRIANAGSYFAEAVTIGAQDLTIDGAYAACADTVASGASASISGQGGAAAPVFSISGAGIRRFQNLTIVRGDQTATGEGGGINFDGSGELVLSNVGLAFNVAGYGGGINFNGTGGDAVLTLLGNTVVQLNRAITGGGGGIRMEGAAQVYMLEPRILITSNEALNGVGGGLLLLNDAYAIIASEGFGNGVITGNSARDGGGVGLVASSTNDDSILLMYSTNAAKPVSLRDNIASGVGGAIYQLPFAGVNGLAGQPLVCLNSFNITGNRAQNGAALYGDTGTATFVSNVGSTLALNSGNCGLASTGAVACTPGINGCNTIQGQVSETTAGVATQGATILMQDNATARLRDVTLFDNRGGSLIRTILQGDFRLQNALVVRNTVTGPLMRISNGSGSSFLLRHSTVVSNTIGASQVIQFEDGPQTLKVNNNLIFQPGKTSVTLPFAIATSPNYNWDYNATSDTTQILPPPWQAFTTDPRFNSDALGDFRLRIGSRLVDVFPDLPATTTLADLYGRPRPISLAFFQSGRAMDVGAFERQETDPWLLNGDFDGNTNYWPSDTPGLTSYSTLNVTGSTGGSVRFQRDATVGATVPAYNIGVQCFNVPGPGIYRLSGAGRGTATNFTPGTTPYLFWRVRSNSANCAQAAPVALEGTLFLPNQGIFANVGAPAEIVIGPAIWTTNTTIEVRLDVQMTPLAGFNEASFDNIRLTGVSIEKVFANGFE
jgi:hypothetical protein